MVQTSSWLLLRVWKEPALAKPILHDWRVRTGTVEEPNNSKKNKNFSGDPLKMEKSDKNRIRTCAVRDQTLITSRCRTKF